MSADDCGCLLALSQLKGSNSLQQTFFISTCINWKVVLTVGLSLIRCAVERHLLCTLWITREERVCLSWRSLSDSFWLCNGISFLVIFSPSITFSPFFVPPSDDILAAVMFLSKTSKRFFSAVPVCEFAIWLSTWSAYDNVLLCRFSLFFARFCGLIPYLCKFMIKEFSYIYGDSTEYLPSNTFSGCSDFVLGSRSVLNASLTRIFFGLYRIWWRKWGSVFFFNYIMLFFIKFSLQWLTKRRPQFYELGVLIWGRVGQIRW